jgi:ABC-type sugar transport system substrate-binding protein
MSGMRLRNRAGAGVVVGLVTAGVIAAVSSGGTAVKTPSSGRAGDVTATAASASKVVAADKVAVNAAEGSWTKWEGPTTPARAPKHVKLALIVCAGTVAGCTEPAQEAADAAKSLGWSTTTYDGQGIPSTQNQMITQAVNSGANAIILAGVDPTAVSSAMKAAAAKHIPVGSMTEGVAPGNGIAYDIGANYFDSGELAGQWIVANSDGKADVLPTNDKEFKSTVALVNGAISEVKACSTCKVLSTQYFVATDIGNGLGARIAQTLQQNPSVNYVIGAFDPAVSDMVPAIKAQGLGNKVKIVSDVGLSQNLSYIKDGDVQAADVVFDNQYVGYAAVDQMIRLLDHKPLAKSSGQTNPAYLYNENVPYHLMTKANVGNPNTPWHADINTVARFEKLWK